MPSRVGSRSGLTLLELIVSLAVIGALLAVLLPAVAAAKRSADSLSCKNKLKQLSLAVQNYTGIFGTGPDVKTLPIRLARQLEYEAESIYAPTGGNIRSSPAVWRCPSDQIDPSYGAFSYVASNGVAYWDYFAFGSYDRSRFPKFNILAEKEVTDGSSNTVLFSEMVLTEENQDPELSFWIPPAGYEPPVPPGVPAVRFVWETGPSQFGVSPTVPHEESLALFAADCDQPQSRIYVNRAGVGHQNRRDLRYQTLNDPGFNAVNTPNTASCVPEAMPVFPENYQQETPPEYGSYAASSFHPGTVNAARFDGSVQSVSEEIDPAVWQALNSSNGSD